MKKQRHVNIINSRPPGTASGSRQCRRDSIWNPTLGYS